MPFCALSYVIRAWDIKNEPDHPNNIDGHDDWNQDPAKRDIIVPWLNWVTAAVHAADGNHIVSIGIRWWTNIQAVINSVGKTCQRFHVDLH